MAMSEKAKKYLKEIKGAKTIPELKDVEIAIKRDGILAWAEFTKLNEAVEEKKFALRKKKQETSLQEILFWAYKKESDKLLKMMDEGADKDAIQMQVQRYDSIGQIIAEADLEDEYEV
ncbi:hypothetical protein [Enterococcus faecium]|uniref:hypothetical protein n=1 Tax=Enterococcus faecium TaxID=1352 RepID=UPI0034E966C0